MKGEKGGSEEEAAITQKTFLEVGRGGLKVEGLTGTANGGEEGRAG